jgi:hypothetical protein
VQGFRKMYPERLSHRNNHLRRGRILFSLLSHRRRMMACRGVSPEATYLSRSLRFATFMLHRIGIPTITR